MKSTEYLKDIMNDHYLDVDELDEILTFLGYIARDNRRYDVDSFLDELHDELEALN